MREVAGNMRHLIIAPWSITSGDDHSYHYHLLPWEGHPESILCEAWFPWSQKRWELLLSALLLIQVSHAAHTRDKHMLTVPVLSESVDKHSQIILKS